jgi:hypothetical protein
MTRKECLDKAAGCVLRDRNNAYGGPEDSFGVIANFWSVYLGRKVYPHDVAMMMSLLKIARIKANKGYADGYIDLAGYAACGAECAEGKPAPKADEEPEFKPGDRVEVNAMTTRDLWEPATVVEVVDGACRVEFVDGYRQLRPLKYVRPVPKAEGCEELVEKDAPQTPEEVCRHIVDCNPATFGRPRTPTGEELAEMAEEETHG